MSSSADFRRQMPEASRDLRQPVSLAQRWHIDVPLLVLLLMLTGFGLLVLYSASGQNIYYMKRQIMFFVLAYGVMFTVAQFRLYTMESWAVWFYAGGVFLLVMVLFFGVGARGSTMVEYRRLPLSALGNAKAGGALDGYGLLVIENTAAQI